MALPPTRTTPKPPVSRPLVPDVPWIVAHWQQIGLAFSAVFVAALLAVFVVYNLNKLKERAWEQFSFAQGQAAQGKRAEALQTVDSLLASNRKGPLAAQANLFKGDLLLADGKKAEALAAYQESLRQSGTAQLRHLAQAGLAAGYEEDQQWAKAEAECQKFSPDFPEHFLTARIYAALGRLQVIQNKWADAQGTLEHL